MVNGFLFQSPLNQVIKGFLMVKERLVVSLFLLPHNVFEGNKARIILIVEVPFECHQVPSDIAKMAKIKVFFEIYGKCVPLVFAKRTNIGPILLKPISLRFKISLDAHKLALDLIYASMFGPCRVSG